MTSALLYFCLIESVAIPTAVVLSVCSGVDYCGCPISIRVWRMGIPIFALMYNKIYSASAADVTTVWIMLVVFRMAPFGVYLCTGLDPR